MRQFTVIPKKREPIVFRNSSDFLAKGPTRKYNEITFINNLSFYKKQRMFEPNFTNGKQQIMELKAARQNLQNVLNNYKKSVECKEYLTDKFKAKVTNSGHLAIYTEDGVLIAFGSTKNKAKHFKLAHKNISKNWSFVVNTFVKEYAKTMLDMYVETALIQTKRNGPISLVILHNNHGYVCDTDINLHRKLQRIKLEQNQQNH